jgi:hypothetical protein
MTNTVAILREVANIAAAVPWYVSTLLLLIVLALSVGWMAMRIEKAAAKLTTIQTAAHASATEIASLLKARSRPIVFLLWLLSGAALAIVWFAFPAVTRASCLMMVFLGGIFFLLLAYLIVDLWWYLAVRRLHREHPELRETEARQ